MATRVDYDREGRPEALAFNTLQGYIRVALDSGLSPLWDTVVDEDKRAEGLALYNVWLSVNDPVVALRVRLDIAERVPQPSAEDFLKYTFAVDSDGLPLDHELFGVFQIIIYAAITNSAGQATFWYNQMIHGSRASLLVVQEGALQAGGFGLALSQLALCAGLQEPEKDIIRRALIKFGLPGGLI